MDLISSTRPVIFIITIISFLALERVISRHQNQYERKRMASNIGLGFAGIFVIKVIAPLSLVHAAFLTQDRDFGLLQWLNLAPLSLPLGLVLFDLLLYWQHRFFHKIDFLWQFHRLHHEEQFLDITSGVRFHPIEYLISYALKLVFVLALGIGPWTILICEVWLSSISIFSHSNINIPIFIEEKIKRFVITADYHFVHHSNKSTQMNSNFCNGFAIWDKLFHSYSQSDKAVIQEINLGVNQDT